MSPIELVVARHRERLEWTRRVPRSLRVSVYDTGAGLVPVTLPHAAIVPLPDVGREDHSYLTHLVQRYDTLAPLTVFCQGHPFDHAHDLHRVLRALDSGAVRVEAFHWLGFIIDSDDARGRRLFVPWSKNRDRRELELDRFHRELFGEAAPEWVRFYPGAQFAVTAACVRTRPRSFYERALALSESFPDAGHCFERLWDRIFGVTAVDPAVLGGEMCRYLKPIRRLADAAAGGAPAQRTAPSASPDDPPAAAPRRRVIRN